MDALANLPPGFVMDDDAAPALPAGFVEDQPQAAQPQQAQPAPQEEPAPYAEPQIKPRNDFLHTAHNFVTGVSDQALKGATFGFSDEANAGMRAIIRGIGNLVTGQAPEIGANYDRALKDERIGQDMFREAHPLPSLAANVAGGLAAGGVGAGIAPGAGAVASTGRALIPDLVAGAKSVPGMVGRSAGVGAASGAVGGFGDAEGGFEERAKGAIEGAAVGGAAGAAIPGALAVGNEVIGRIAGLAGLRNADNDAADFAVRALSRDKFDLSGVGPSPSYGDKPVAIADMAGGNTRRLGRTVQTTPGEGSEHAERFLHERQYGQADRIKDDIDTHISSQDRIDSVAARKEQRQAESRPLYEQAFSAKPVHSDRIQQFLADPITKAGMRHGLEIQRLEALAENRPFRPSDYAITDFNEAGDPILEAVPNMRLLDATKRGLDAQLEPYRNAITGKLDLDERGRAIDQVRRAYVDELDNLNGDYAAARAAYAEPSRLLDATAKGRDVLKGNTQETVRNFDAMDAPAQDAYRIGAADTLKETVGNSRDGVHSVPRIYGGDNARARVNMLADDKDAFGRKMALEDSMNKTRNTVTGGSVTGRIEADKEDAGMLQGMAISAMNGGGITGAISSLLNRANSKSNGMNENVAEKLSQILFNSDQGQNANALANLVARAQQNQQTVRKVGATMGNGSQTIGNLLGQFMAPEERR